LFVIDESEIEVSFKDFWTSGIYNPTLTRWQWLLANNNSRLDIDSSILTQYEISSSGKKKRKEFVVNCFHSISVGQSLHFSFAQLSNRRLVASSSSETYSSLCKISATRVFLNNDTRGVILTSQQTGFYNQ